jgi:hypothetical protein
MIAKGLNLVLVFSGGRFSVKSPIDKHRQCGGLASSSLSLAQISHDLSSYDVARWQKMLSMKDVEKMSHCLYFSNTYCK